MRVLIELPNENYQVMLTKIMLACRGCKITELLSAHGDLIDRDKLIAEFGEKDHYPRIKIKDAETVIPAESEGKK